MRVCLFKVTKKICIALAFAATLSPPAPREGQTLNEFVRVGDQIFFPWYDKATGLELWGLRP